MPQAVRRRSGPAGAALVFAALATSPVAAEIIYDVQGFAVGADRSTVIEVAPDRSLIMLRVDYAPAQLGDPRAPLHGASGPCFGTIELRGSATEGSGYCTWKDIDGSFAVIAWTADGRGRDGAVTGAWTARGGTGKWAGAEGAGRYSAATRPRSSDRTLMLDGSLSLR